VLDLPETQYARTDDGAHLAYQVVGQSPPELVFLPVGATHVELAWEIPIFARVFWRLASFSRLIRFDMRGSGLSDPFNAELPSLEQQAADMLAVLNAAGAERPALVANQYGGLLAMFFAATYPNRVSSLVLDGCTARMAGAPDYPFGVLTEFLDLALARYEQEGQHGGADSLRYSAPTVMRDPDFLVLYERYSRSVHGLSTRRALAELFLFADVRPALPAVQAPTLVLYRVGDRFIGQPHADYLAQHIPGAKLVELPGDDNMIFAGDSDADVDQIEEFLTGAAHAGGTDRVLATVLFTDIVSSTERAATLGDRAWRDLLDGHDRVVRRQLERSGAGRSTPSGMVSLPLSTGRVGPFGAPAPSETRSPGWASRSGLVCTPVRSRCAVTTWQASPCTWRSASQPWPSPVTCS
jgi:pimeloyl-ACP methyl ester carboxylesterase